MHVNISSTCLFVSLDVTDRVQQKNTKKTYFPRFWTSEKGERIVNPFLLCCNLVSVSGGSGSSVGLRLEVSLHREDDEDVGLLSHLDTEVSLVPGAPLRCVAATNSSLDKHLIRDSGDVVFEIRLVTLFIFIIYIE